MFRRLVHRTLDALVHGRLTLIDAEGASSFGASEAARPLHGTIVVHDPSFWRAVATRGVVGAGEAFMDGAWDADDLTSVVRVMARDQSALESLDSGLARLAWPLLRLFVLRHRNTRDGSRENISAHYDLGNPFFEQFLDRSLTYSSAIFERAGMTLEEAQAAKYERICRKLALRSSDHVLEIGTGWGGFAMHAASRHGCRVTTTTISEQQYEMARQRIHDAGLDDRVHLLKRDYRDLVGRYDKLVSIEMVEAVGHRFMGEFFRTCADRLKPDGAMLLQAIVNPDRGFEESTRSVDFIKRYIFPGGQLPSIGSMLDAARRETDLRLVHLEDITPHYAATLAEWRLRMKRNIDRMRELGCSERFLRMWEFYLCYCEGGFLERSVGTVQVVFERQDSRRSWTLGTSEGIPGEGR